MNPFPWVTPVVVTFFSFTVVAVLSADSLQNATVILNGTTSTTTTTVGPAAYNITGDAALLSENNTTAELSPNSTNSSAFTPPPLKPTVSTTPVPIVPIEHASVSTWPLVAIGLLVTVAGVLTILLVWRHCNRRRRSSDRRHLLGAMSQEGFFVGSQAERYEHAL